MPFSSDGFLLTDVDDMQNYGTSSEPGGLRAASGFGAAAAGEAAAQFIDPPPPQQSGTFAFLDEMFGPLHGWGAPDDHQRGSDAHQQGGLDLASHQSSLPHLRTSSKNAAQFSGRRASWAHRNVPQCIMLPSRCIPQ